MPKSKRWNGTHVRTPVAIVRSDSDQIVRSDGMFDVKKQGSVLGESEGEASRKCLHTATGRFLPTLNTPPMGYEFLKPLVKRLNRFSFSCSHVGSSSFCLSGDEICFRQGSEKLNQALPFVESIQRKRLDEVELSAITLLLLARYGLFELDTNRALLQNTQLQFLLEANLFVSEEERQKFTDVILRDLSGHYENTSKEFTTAFDRITSMIAEFHVRRCSSFC